MNQRYEQQMKKGILDMLILKLLMQEEKYGYRLIQELKTKSEGRITLKEGTLYPALYRLEEEGWIKSRWSEATEKEGAKKYYGITPQGEQALAELKTTWNEFSLCVKRIMEVQDI